MSFNIPIIFDDSPFFERDSFFGRQPRNKRFIRQGRQPDVFQTWARPEFLFDDPNEERLYRRNYRNRPRQEEFMPRRSDRSGGPQREGSEEEDISDQEEPSGVNADPRDHYGWDIPVQFVERPVTRNRHHRHKHVEEPQQHTRKNKTQGDSDGQGKACEQRKQKPIHRDIINKTANGVPVETTERKTEKTEKGDKDELAEKVPVKDAAKEQERRGKVEPKDLPSNDVKAVDSSKKSNESDGDIDIPVQHSAPEEEPLRRRSKRFSQCDPPSPADIKLTRIKSIVEKSPGLEDKIKEFDDPLQNKKFLYISEILMKLLLDLDTVDSDGIDVVRKARKEGVLTIQNLVEQLENKLAENKKNVVPE